jgi:hypothetical protein
LIYDLTQFETPENQEQFHQPNIIGCHECVERKAKIPAMARAVQADTRVSRQHFQRRNRAANSPKTVARHGFTLSVSVIKSGISFLCTILR